MEEFLRLPCIRINVTVISFELGFLFSLNVVLRYTEEVKCYEMFYYFKFSLSPLNLFKNGK